MKSPTDSPGISNRIAVGALTLLSIPILFYGLGSYSVVNGDEGFYHLISRTMLTSGDWFRLDFTGEQRFYDTFLNAPLHYWLRANIIRILGDNLFSMRIHAAVFGLLTVLATHRLVLRIGTPRAAFFSGLALLTSYQFVFKHSARTGEAETLICFAFVMAASTFVSAVFEGKSFYPHFIWVVILMNLKSPLVLIPLVVGALHFAFVRESRIHLRDWTRAAFILPLGTLWHLGQLVQIGTEGQKALLAMAGKITEVKSEAEAGNPWWFNIAHFAKVTFSGAFPHSVAYPLAVVGLVRSTGEPILSRKWGVIGLYAAVIFVFYFLIQGTHHPWYILPAIPFLSALLGIWLDRLPSRSSPFEIRFAVIVVVVAVATIQIDYHNPFSVRAIYTTYSLLHLREFTSFPVLAAVSALAAFAVIRVLASRFNAPSKGNPEPLGLRGLTIIGIVLFATAMLRVVEPLADVRYLSETDRLKQEIDTKQTRGESLLFPIGVPTRDFYTVRFYFGNDFEIVETPKQPGREFRYLLAGEGRTSLKPLRLDESAGGRPDTTPSLIAKPDTPPNIILYVIDTLRSDALGPYGNRQVDTPAIDAFAKEGMLFFNASVQSSWTRASMASLLSSTYPAVHGAEDRGDLLSDSSLLLSEVFNEAGYHTAIFTTNPNIGTFFGFDQGFDDFVELYARREVGDVKSSELNTTAEDVSRAATKWIRTARQPFFLVVLAIDPHTPYSPPARFDRYADQGPDGFTGTPRGINRENLTPAEKTRIRSLYLGEVSYSDSAFGEILEQIDEIGARDHTAIALTSDHGEEFWEHGQRGHGRSLFEETLRVPFILRYPAVLPKGKRIDRSIESIDIGPSLVQLAGLPVPNAMKGRSVFSDDRTEATVYSSLRLQEHQLDAVRDGDWKWIWNQHTQRGALYDLRETTLEAADVGRENPDVVARMMDLLARHREQNREDADALHAGAGSRSVPDREIPETERALLEHLGYFDDEATPGEAPTERDQ